MCPLLMIMPAVSCSDQQRKVRKIWSQIYYRDTLQHRLGLHHHDSASRNGVCEKDEAEVRFGHFQVQVDVA